MKLQVAFDGTLGDSLAVLRAVRDSIDIAEIGTPLIYREGLHAVRAFREVCPDITLLADLKIMDAGKAEATLAFEAGCDYVTVLGVTQDETVCGALEAAAQYGGRVMADLMQVRDLIARGHELLDMGCHCLCVHTAYDRQAAGANPLGHLACLRESFPAASLAVAGGVNLQSLDALKPYRPEIVIVGGAIVGAREPAEIARVFRAQMDGGHDL